MPRQTPQPQAAPLSHTGRTSCPTTSITQRFIVTDYLSILRNQLAAHIDTRNEQKQALAGILDAPTAEQRDLSEDETAAFAAARDAISATDAAIATIRTRIDELENIVADQTMPAEGAPTETPASARNARVISEARTYSTYAEQRDGVSFLRDVAASQRFGDIEASQRLARHMAEERVERPSVERRAVGTSAFAGLVVPQYLTDLVAPTRRAARPLADIANQHALPASGMTVNISRVTTGSTAALQSSQNSGVSETNMDDTLLTIDVLTTAGQQTVSMQALERGSSIESIVLGDLLGAVNTNVDNTIITQATTGLNAVTDANIDVAYTDGTPTAAELWPKLFDVVQQIQSNVYAGPSHFVMHPRRFWWMASNVGTNFPFVTLANSAPQQGGTVVGTGYGTGPSGYLAGLPVIVDANVATNLGAGTNEDAIYCVTADEVHLWEDDAVFIRAEQTNAASLGVLFVAYKYFAYTVSRYPNAHGRINGTGLVTPTF